VGRVADETVGDDDVLDKRHKLDRHIVPVSDADERLDVIGRFAGEDDITLGVNDEQPVAVRLY